MALFGEELHVSSGDAAALEQALVPFKQATHEWRLTSTSLEDVFIHLVGTNKDNF